MQTRGECDTMKGKKPLFPNPKNELFISRTSNSITIFDEVCNPFFRITHKKQPMSKVKKELENFLGRKLDLLKDKRGEFTLSAAYILTIIDFAFIVANQRTIIRGVLFVIVASILTVYVDNKIGVLKDCAVRYT